VKCLLIVILISLTQIATPVVLSAQVNEINIQDSLRTRPDSIPVVPQKDLAEVIGRLFRKNKIDTARIDTFTSKPVYSFVAAIGYTLQTRLAAVIAGNLAFRPNQNSNLSTITSNATYTQNKQFFWPIQTTFWTKGNKLVFVGDLRYYKYPQSTFGLGSEAPVENEDPMDYSFTRLYEVVFKKIAGNFYGGLGYIVDYRWNISHKGNINGTASDYAKYGETTNSISTGFTINSLYDTRDNPINASDGSYTYLQFRNNFKALGSNSTWRSLIIDFRKYFTLSEKTQNVLAFWSYNWLVLDGKPPYLDLPSNGWDSYSSTGRGYIQGRFRGSQMVYLESELRFRISRNGLFGGVLFGNAQTFSGESGTGLQKIQPGFGTGLRIKINKASRTNLAIDYGFGSQGSKGLFISVGEYF
jgi:hypothetical protein